MHKLNVIFAVKVATITSSLLPLVYLIYMAIRNRVNVPSYDEWYYIPMFEKMFLGTLTFSDLWATVNEHRLLVPKLILLLSVRLTHWNLNYLVALNIIVGIGVFLILVRFLLREKKVFHDQYYFFVFPLVSLLLFSLVQYENWLWGVQTLIFINELAVLAGFYYVTKDNLSYKHLIFAFLAGLFATLSHLSGLLFWPIGFLCIFTSQKTKRIKKKKFALIWLLVSTVIFTAYFENYYSALQAASSLPTISFQRLSEILVLTMAILGSPLELFSKSISGLIGSVGLAVFSILYILACKVQRFTSFLLFLLAVALYGVISSLMTAFGRISYEPPYIASRYSSFPILFWISLVVLIFSLYTIKIKRISFVKTLGVIFVILIFLLSINSSRQGTVKAGARSKVMKTALHGFLSEPFPGNMNRIATVYPRFKNNDGQYVVYLPHIVQKLDILAKYRLSFFYDYQK